MPRRSTLPEQNTLLKAAAELDIDMTYNDRSTIGEIEPNKAVGSIRTDDGKTHVKDFSHVGGVRQGSCG